MMVLSHFRILKLSFLVVLLLLLLLHCCCYSFTGGRKPKPIDEKVLASVFDTAYIEKLQSDWEHQLTPKQQINVFSKLGKLGLYMRHYRLWVSPPRSKKKMNPRELAPTKFHSNVFDSCSDAGARDVVRLEDCVNRLYHHVQNRTSFLFPGRSQWEMDYRFEERTFIRYINRYLFAYDMSLSQLLCFWTRRRLPFMRRLPFCRYGTHPDQLHTWPAMAMRDLAQRDDIHSDVLADPRHGDEGFREPIDTILGGDDEEEEDFACAEESFCPDPCCGLTRGRITHAALGKHGAVLPECPDSPCRVARPPGGGGEDAPDDANEKVHHCVVMERFNKEFMGIRKNDWNLTCIGCPTGRVWEFDAMMCVRIDECAFVKCPENEECINRAKSGFICQCKVGYRRIVTEDGVSNGSMSGMCGVHSSH